MLNNLIHNDDLQPITTLLTDNRQQNDDQDTLWDKLNLSQQYSVCSLGQFGYILTYVRAIGNSSLAILKQNDKIATINEAGIINVSPAIVCRQ